LASVNPEGRLVVRFRAFAYQPRTTYVRPEGGQVVTPVTTYVPTFQLVEQSFAPAEVEAFGTDGRRIERKQLLERLRKEAAVLVSADGRKVDPFHLQVVKEDTLVLVVPLKPRPATVEPLAAPAVPPPAVTPR
jgi:hypothetical protein